MARRHDFADGGNCRIQVFDSYGKLLYLWGTRGSGPGQFMGPWGIAIDSVGDVYVTDAGNHRIQVFRNDGTFVRAWGTKGKATGQFTQPGGLAVDDQGHVFVSDLNDRVQVFTTDGTFVRAWGSRGNGDGQFTQPSFPGDTGPSGIVVNRQGEVYVADSWNSRVQVFTREGQFLRKFGGLAMPGGQFNTPAAIAAGQRGGALNTPEGLAIDADGNVFVANEGRMMTLGAYNVQKFTPEGEFLNRWGRDGYGPGQFTAPTGVAVDAAGNFYVADAGNNRVQKFNKHGQFLLQWGSIGDGLLRRPMGLTLDRAGNLLVADTGNKRVQKFSSTGQFLGKWGKPTRSGWLLGELVHPNAVAADENRIYVADLVAGNVQVTDSDGEFLHLWKPNTGRHGDFLPRALYVDGKHRIYAVETGKIHVFDINGASLQVMKQPRHASAMAIAIDDRGQMFIAETHDDEEWSRVRVLSPTGKETARWSLDQPGEAASSNVYMAIDASGRVFVTDWRRCRVRVFSASGARIGEWGSCGFGDGQFDGMTGLAVGADGLVYVSDYSNNRVQVFRVTAVDRR